MQAFTRLDAIAAPLPIANIDTDKILPAPFLKTITREGAGRQAVLDAAPGGPGVRAQPRALERSGQPHCAGQFWVRVEPGHAPWALLDFGIRCVIAPSIADIFYNNCLKNVSVVWRPRLCGLSEALFLGTPVLQHEFLPT
jgi:3-isopropylmalate/(R)-2-methylmalate dehydratase small subunit